MTSVKENVKAYITIPLGKSFYTIKLPTHQIVIKDVLFFSLSGIANVSVDRSLNIEQLVI